MHFSTLLITREFPTEEKIEEIMDIYNEANYYDQYSEDDSIPPIQKPIVPLTSYWKPLVPLINYDWYQIGGRYNGRLKLNVNDENTKKYEWDYYARESRNGRLFHSYLLSKYHGQFFFNEEDLFPSMGMNDGFLYVDGANIQDIRNFNDVSCYYCIDTVNHNVAMQGYYDIEKEKWIYYDDTFPQRLQEIKDMNQEGYATILDIHD